MGTLNCQLLGATSMDNVRKCSAQDEDNPKAEAGYPVLPHPARIVHDKVDHNYFKEPLITSSESLARERVARDATAHRETSRAMVPGAHCSRPARAAAFPRAPGLPVHERWRASVSACATAPAASPSKPPPARR